MADSARHGVMELAHQLVVKGVLARREDEQPPVTVLTGPGGSGHTAVLEAIAAELSQLPHVLLNAAHITTAGAAQGAPPSIPDLITSMTFELVRHQGARCTFPRYLIGRLVIGLRLDDLVTARAIDQVRAEIARVKDPDAFAARLTSIVTAVPLPGLQDVPDAAIQESISLLITGLTRWGPTRRLALMTGVDWYDAGNGPLTELVALNRLARVPGPDAAAGVVRKLLRAFLADVQAQAPRWSRARGLVLLLDNADSAPAVAFLKGLAAVRERGGPAAPADNLTVIAASRGLLLDRIGLADDLYPLDDGQVGDVLAQRRVLPRRWLPVALPELSSEDVNATVNELGIPLAARYRVVRTITDLTRSHPLATELLLRAAALQTAPTRPYDPAVLLGQRVPPDPDSPTVEQQILSSMLRGLPPGQREDLVTLAAARTHDEADLLAHRSTLLRTALVADRAPLLSRTYWCVRDGRGDPAMHPLLRRLLLRQLAARTTAGKSWADVFGWLAANVAAAPTDPAADPATADEPVISELHHAYAVGELLSVSIVLAHLLKVRDGSGWLAMVQRIVATPAPGPPSSAPAQELQRTVDGLAKRHRLDPADAVVTVARLVAAWRAAGDPLVTAERADLHTLVATCLNALTTTARSEFSVLDAEADRHRELARTWSEGAEPAAVVPTDQRAGSPR